METSTRIILCMDDQGSLYNYMDSTLTVAPIRQLKNIVRKIINVSQIE
jgi:hypothetical protein